MAIGDAIVVPVVSPSSATWLGVLAARLARPDHGRVIPLSVVAPGADARYEDAADSAVRQAEAAARAAGARVHGMVVHHPSIAGAVVETVDREHGTLALMGWQGSGHGGAFGELVDSVLGSSRAPLALVRQHDHPFDRVVLPVSAQHLEPEGALSLELAADLAHRLADDDVGPVMLLRAGEALDTLPQRVLTLTERVHHDPRQLDRALAAAARPGDLVVIPAAPTVAGLRAATTELAWAAPQSWLLVAVAGGPGAAGRLAAAVRLAGRPRAPVGDDIAGRHEVIVTLGCRQDTPSQDQLVQVIGTAGTVTDVAEWHDRRGRPWRQVAVHVDAPTASDAVGAVMAAVAADAALVQAEIDYEVNRRRLVPRA